MKNILDLRDKSNERVKVVERIIIKPRSLIAETLKVFFAVFIVYVLVWGVSNADDLFSDGYNSASSNFSAIGTVGEVKENTLSLTDADGSDSKKGVSYDLNIKYVEKIETSNYVPLIITDIQTGDKVVVQGITDGNKIFIKRIVSFSIIEPRFPLVENQVASSTEEISVLEDEVSTSTSTSTPEDVGTSTQESASSTPGVFETVVEVVEEIVDGVVDAVQGAINAATGNEDNASSTAEVIEQHQEEVPTESIEGSVIE